ncbi:carbohydrate kinase family protein [Adhaeribacter radiodurans]|uniref:Carbohydrate kinase n=1 Tax=Adhaeribacter radiodurans TaxID=2745197 RepID=A0A7L7L875_9BACT|nr:carbohydrate kinase [Adhaeribacter radiodurans]QMU28589.1 carbohydrate kinase [Adhaeribacter radiodurans]
MEKIICFGETLWDMLPTGKMPGGAPMNVAIHLKYNGYDPVMISRVGNDDLGKELVAYLKAKKMDVTYIQTGQTHLTGVVKANITNKNEVSYKIVEPVAWDYIQYDDEVAELVKHSDVFIYGSLAARSVTTQETLLKYLPLAKLKVFDVNLRPPHYTQQRVQQLLQFADIAKMNHLELREIVGWLGAHSEEKTNMEFLKKFFNLKQLIVTRGENGAAALTAEGYFEQAGYLVEVEDTIGSGDAFLATYLSNYLQQQPTSVCLQKACLIGAFVATRPGATPEYDPTQVGETFTQT